MSALQIWLQNHNKRLTQEAIDEALMEYIGLVEKQRDELLDAIESALAVIDDYLAYEHNGDPWTEDARTMGEMEINDYETDGRLDAARAAVANAKGGEQ